MTETSHSQQPTNALVVQEQQPSAPYKITPATQIMDAAFRDIVADTTAIILDLDEHQIVSLADVTEAGKRIVNLQIGTEKLGALRQVAFARRVIATAMIVEMPRDSRIYNQFGNNYSVVNYPFAIIAASATHPDIINALLREHLDDRFNGSDPKVLELLLSLAQESATTSSNYPNTVLYNAGLLAKIFPIQELPLLPLPAQPKELDAPVDEAKGEQIVIDAPQ